MHLVLLLGLALAAQPSAPPDPAPSATPEERYRQQLTDALLAYQGQNLDEAITLFSDLISDNAVPLKMRQEARIYLAEIKILQGEYDKADRYFELVLVADPYYQIDRFKHPPDVTSRFEEYNNLYGDDIRRANRPPLQGNVFALFPVVYETRIAPPKFNRLVLGVQVPAFLISVAGFSYLMINDLNGNFQNTPEDRALVRQVRITQWTAAGIGTAAWGFRAVRSSRHWRDNFQAYSTLQFDENNQARWIFVGVKGKF